MMIFFHSQGRFAAFFPKENSIYRERIESFCHILLFAEYMRSWSLSIFYVWISFVFEFPFASMSVDTATVNSEGKC